MVGTAKPITPKTYGLKVKATDALNKQAAELMHSNLAEAQQQALGAEHLALQAGYSKGLADAMRNLGIINELRSLTDEAFGYYKEALAIYRKLDDEKGLALVFNDFGCYYFKTGEYATASKYYLKSLQLKEKNGDRRGEASTLQNLGLVYSYQNNYVRAKQAFFKALQTTKKIKDDALLAAIQNNLGEIYIFQHQYGQAIQHLELSIAARERSGQKIGLASAYCNMGYAYLHCRRFKEAMEASYKCISVSKEQGLENELVLAQINISEIHRLTKNYAEAESILAPLFKTLKKSANLALLDKAYRGLFTLYYSKKDYRKALSYFRQYHKIQMKLLNSENLKQINEMSAKYQAGQKEKEKEIFRLKNVELKNALDRLGEEKKRSDDLLKNILPLEIAEELKIKRKSAVKYYERVSVMFIDIKNFTNHSLRLSPQALVEELDYCFLKFDEILDKYKLEKIKTIGDAYMCAGGLPRKMRGHAVKITRAALEIIAFMKKRKREMERKNQHGFEVRIGIHTGPVIAGIIGAKRFAYDIWGDTVNTAARMEQNSEEGRINVSKHTYRLISRYFNCTHRGKLPAKNKGEIDMYFVNA